MMRICVLGNSYSRCLVWAARGQKLQNRLHVTPTFFAANRARLLGLKPEKDTLVPNNPELAELLRLSSGGDGILRLADYDAFVICGVDRAIWRAVAVYETHQVFGHLTGSPASLMSEPALRSTLAAAYATTVAVYLTKRVKRSKKPVFLMPSPMPGEDFARLAGCQWMEQKTGKENALGWLGSLVRQDGEAFAREQGVIFVAQPEHTLTRSRLTKTRFVRGYAGSSPRPGFDCVHMNADYGALMWEFVTSRLKREANWLS